MSLKDDFKDEMAQSVTIANVTSSGLYGPTYGPGTAFPCHVKQELRTIKDQSGREAVSGAQIYLDGHPAVGYDSKVTCGGTVATILKISRKFDERGRPYATVIYL